MNSLEYRCCKCRNWFPSAAVIFRNDNSAICFHCHTRLCLEQKGKTVMKRTRNPNANCENCPYCETMNGNYKHDGIPSGYCMLYPVERAFSLRHWCGQHPDFWAEEEAPRHDPGVLAMQALAETDEEDDSWKYRTCRECKHRGSMCGCGRFYLGRTLEFIPDKNNCPLFKEGDPDEKEES